MPLPGSSIAWLFAPWQTSSVRMLPRRPPGGEPGSPTLVHHRRRHLPLRLLEMLQVGRRLTRPARLQLAVDPDVVGLPFKKDIVVVLRATMLDPVWVAGAGVTARHGPGPRQRVVDGRDLIAQDVRVRLVEEDTLLDDGLIVLVQRNAARIEDARPLELARLDLEHVVAAVAILIDPLPDRVAGEGTLDILRPVAAVGIDA